MAKIYFVIWYKTSWRNLLHVEMQFKTQLTYFIKDANLVIQLQDQTWSHASYTELPVWNSSFSSNQVEKKHSNWIVKRIFYRKSKLHIENTPSSSDQTACVDTHTCTFCPKLLPASYMVEHMQVNFGFWERIQVHPLEGSNTI